MQSFFYHLQWLLTGLPSGFQFNSFGTSHFLWNLNIVCIYFSWLKNQLLGSSKWWGIWLNPSLWLYLFMTNLLMIECIEMKALLWRIRPSGSHSAFRCGRKRPDRFLMEVLTEYDYSFTMTTRTRYRPWLRTGKGNDSVFSLTKRKVEVGGGCINILAVGSSLWPTSDSAFHELRRVDPSRLARSFYSDITTVCFRICQEDGYTCHCVGSTW